MSKKTKNNHAVIILDETGSMLHRTIETIGSVNNYIDNLEPDTLVTLVSFNSCTGVDVRCVDVKPAQVPRLSQENYRAQCNTPLYDAIGASIANVRERASRKSKVVFLIVTDGEENASKEYNAETIKILITDLERSGWAFAYVGAAPDAWGGNAAIGVMLDNSMQVEDKPGALKSAMLSNSRMTSRYFEGQVSNRALYAEPEKKANA